MSLTTTSTAVTDHDPDYYERRMRLCGECWQNFYRPSGGHTWSHRKYCHYQRCPNCHRYYLSRWVSRFAGVEVDKVVDLAHEGDIPKLLPLWRGTPGVSYAAILKAESGARVFLRGSLSVSRVMALVNRIEGAVLKADQPDGPTTTALVNEAMAYDEQFPFKVQRVRTGKGFFSGPGEWGGSEGEGQEAGSGSAESAADCQEPMNVEVPGRGVGMSEKASTSESEVKEKVQRWTMLDGEFQNWLQDRLEEGWVRRDRGAWDPNWTDRDGPVEIEWPEELGEPPKQVPMNPRRRK